MLFNAVPNADGSFGEETRTTFLQYLNDVMLAYFHKDLCIYWIQKNINNYTVSYIRADDISMYDVKLGEVIFGFVSEDSRRFFAYFDCVPDVGLTDPLWEKIETATKDRPFYDSEYFLCTVNRVPDNYCTLSKQYDNFHIVQQKSLFIKFKKDYNRRVHPKFVTSFVRRKS